MKILLAHNSLYFPSHGGGDRSNRLLMEALAARGHEVRVMARVENFGEAAHESFLAELNQRATPVRSIGEGIVTFDRNGVNVRTVTNNPHIRAIFAKQTEEFDPDIIICSTDDPGALLLEVALRARRARIVYFVRATVAVPFGPDCAFPNPAKTEMLGHADSIVGVSEYVAAYVREWSGYPAIHVPISLLESGDYSDIGRFDNEFVLMVNPCAVKGISIFLALAESMPDVTFAAVPTWGTNGEDLSALRRFHNIHIFEPIDDIAELLRRTRAVLVPSIWAEARSRMVVESMIRGIPVLASDVGGLHEAKLGVEYLLPVNQIRHYHARVDGNMVPVADVPSQDVAPWRDALQRVLTDRAHFEDLSRRSRAAARAYAENLHCGRLEAHFEQLIRAPKRTVSAVIKSAKGGVEELSPAKRKLMALRASRSQAAKSWFSPIERSAHKILFCFPHAGGGPAAYLAWRPELAAQAEVCAVRPPGFESMEALIRALAEAIRPLLDRPFLFYGHSMGAGVAFELTRDLRRNGAPLPEKLIVSSARAPQLRTRPDEGSDATDDDLLDQLRRLDGLPHDEKLVQALLPLLRADTNLYRRYVYDPEAPLDLPIHVFGGVDDPSLTQHHLESWREQTRSAFSLSILPGGHFFFRESKGEFPKHLLRIL